MVALAQPASEAAGVASNLVWPSCCCLICNHAPHLVGEVLTQLVPAAMRALQQCPAAPAAAVAAAAESSSACAGMGTPTADTTSAAAYATAYEAARQANCVPSHEALLQALHELLMELAVTGTYGLVHWVWVALGIMTISGCCQLPSMCDQLLKLDTTHTHTQCQGGQEVSAHCARAPVEVHKMYKQVCSASAFAPTPSCFHIAWKNQAALCTAISTFRSQVLPAMLCRLCMQVNQCTL